MLYIFGVPVLQSSYMEFRNINHDNFILVMVLLIARKKFRSCYLKNYFGCFNNVKYQKKLAITKKLVTRLLNFPDRRIRYEFYFKKYRHKQKNKFLEFY